MRSLEACFDKPENWGEPREGAWANRICCVVFRLRKAKPQSFKMV